MAMDFNIRLEGKIHTDSTAAIGIVHRSGLGRKRHIQVQFLWIQDCVKEGRFLIENINTKLNPADLLTKHLNAEVRQSHLQRLCMEVKMGKAEAGKNLHRVSANPEASKTFPAGIFPGGESNSPFTSDRWIERKAKDFWERLHVKRRQTLFTPMKIIGGPRYGTEIGDVRVTMGVDNQNNYFYVVDEWKKLRDPHARCERFTGRTVFVDNLEDAFKLLEHEGMGGNKVILTCIKLYVLYSLYHM